MHLYICNYYENVHTVASELLGNLEEMVPWYYMDNNITSILKYSTTYVWPVVDHPTDRD